MLAVGIDMTLGRATLCGGFASYTMYIADDDSLAPWRD